MTFPVVIPHNPACSTSRNVCRPSKTVLDLIDRLPPGPLAKEDGSLLIDVEGNRVL